MKHDTAIPVDLHTRAGSSVKEALGLFWSSLFRDQELVEAEISARVLSACQTYIDAMEALSLRDHSGMPVFHREHWHPALIRLSERNTGCGLTIGMDGGPVIGEQPSGTVFTEGETFMIGGNAEYSKVYTYPLDKATGKRLVSVGTCLCDAISEPEHVLSQGRDFIVRDGILIIRKEHDPFTVSGYNIVEDGDDRIAVIWLCDAEFDREHVGDFLAYPLGFDVKSTPVAAKMLSALWDIVVYGLTPLHLNILLGALFDVPTVPRDTVVESVTDDGQVSTIVTVDDVYKIAKSRVAVESGASLFAGAFLTNELTVYHGLSKGEVDDLVDRGVITSLTLPPGSVAGVEVPVTVANINERPPASGLWFRLSSDDSYDSPFWRSVRARTTAAVQESFVAGLGVPHNLFSISDFAAHPSASRPNKLGAVTVDASAGTVTIAGTASGTGNIYTCFDRSDLATAGMYAFPVAAGKSYEVSCFVAKANGGKNAKIWAFFFDGAGGYLGQANMLYLNDGATSQTVTATDGAAHMSIFFNANCNAGESVTFSDIAVRTSPVADVNPLRAIGYIAIANTVLVHTTRPMVSEPCAAHVLNMLKRLMPATGSILVTQTSAVASALSGKAVVAASLDCQPAQGDSAVTMHDDVSCRLEAGYTVSSSAVSATDSVAFRFFPDTGTEV